MRAAARSNTVAPSSRKARSQVDVRTRGISPEYPRNLKAAGPTAANAINEAAAMSTMLPAI